MTSVCGDEQGCVPLRDEEEPALAKELSNGDSQNANNQTILEKDKKRSQHPFQCDDDASVACGDIKFKSLEWWQCGFIMIAETVSLGILSLPSVLATVGLLPGFILIIGMGILASYSGYTIGQFKQRYPHVQSMADAFEILCTPLGFPNFGKEFGGAAQTLFLVFSMGSHILTWVICFDTITDHAVCNIVWSIIALIVFWLFDLPRTLKGMSHMSIACKRLSIYPLTSPLNFGSLLQYFDSSHHYDDRSGDSKTGTRANALHSLATGGQANCILGSLSICHQYCFCVW